MQSRQKSGDGADISRSSRSRPRSLRPRNLQVQGLPDGTRESRDGAHGDSHERTARSAWCGKHRRKAPPDLLTGRSVQACLSREVPTDHEARGQRCSGCGKSRSAAADLCSGVETQLRRDRDPEAEAEHTTHGRIHTQAVCQSRMTTCMWSNAVLVRAADHAQHVSEHAVHKRTVRHDAAHEAP